MKNESRKNWIYEDQLPEMTKEEYSKWFDESDIVDGVRMGPLIPMPTKETLTAEQKAINFLRLKKILPLTTEEFLIEHGDDQEFSLVDLLTEFTTSQNSRIEELENKIITLQEENESLYEAVKAVNVDASDYFDMAVKLKETQDKLDAMEIKYQQALSGGKSYETAYNKCKDKLDALQEKGDEQIELIKKIESLTILGETNEILQLIQSIING